MAPARGDSSRSPVDAARGEEEQQLRGRVSELEAELAHVCSSTQQYRGGNFVEGNSGRDSNSNDVSVLLREVEALRQTSEQLRQQLAAAEADGRELQSAAASETAALQVELDRFRSANQATASETTALRGELEGLRSANQVLRGQVLAAAGGRGRGEAAVLELDGIAHANRQLQQELASLQRQMRDRQETLQHEVRVWNRGL